MHPYHPSQRRTKARQPIHTFTGCFRLQRESSPVAKYNCRHFEGEEWKNIQNVQPAANLNLLAKDYIAPNGKQQIHTLLPVDKSALKLHVDNMKNTGFKAMIEAVRRAEKRPHRPPETARTEILSVA